MKVDERFIDWCKLATLDELLEEKKAALFLMKECTPGPIADLARMELGVINKNIREIERNDT
jgi:hypothetical protein